MGKQQKGRTWWVSLIAVFVALLLYFIIFESSPRVEKPFVVKEPKTVKTVVPGLEDNGTTDEKIGSRQADESREHSLSEAEAFCTRIKKEMSEFFRYLDSRRYVQAMHLQGGSYKRFKQVLRSLSAHPPIPAGEGVDPRIIIGNLYHFYRVLERKDLRLIKEVLANEQVSMEINMEMFYRWLSSDKRCPDPEGLRPTREILYHYAGFFLNTTGGRAYLFRRTTAARLLTSYYCLLIVHDADRKGANNYGIDILPFIQPLKRDISLYPDLLLRDDYIARLNQLEAYYSKRR